MIKWVIILAILLVGIYSTALQIRNGKQKNLIWTIIATIGLSVFSSWFYDWIKPALPSNENSTYKEMQSTESLDVDYSPYNEKANDKLIVEPHKNIEEHQESSYLGAYIADITEETSVKGKIQTENQEDRYKYTSKVGGTYRFYSDLSAGGSVVLRIKGGNDENIGYGVNEMTIKLEEGKEYILSVEYRDGSCDYDVNIGVPRAISDITGKVTFSGNITYKDQKDQYRYTAPISGTYRFDTNLSAGGTVKLYV